MSTLEKQWQEEYNQIERCRNIRRAQEIDLKNSMKGIEFKLRLVKKDYHKLCLERRACDKVLRNFWKRKKAVRGSGDIPVPSLSGA